MTTHLRPALVLTALFTLLTGIILPLAFTGAAQLVVPYKANGSLLDRHGIVIGSVLLGQNFTTARYFHPPAPAPPPRLTTPPPPPPPTSAPPAAPCSTEFAPHMIRRPFPPTWSPPPPAVLIPTSRRQTHTGKSRASRPLGMSHQIVFGKSSMRMLSGLCWGSRMSMFWSSIWIWASKHFFF